MINTEDEELENFRRRRARASEVVNQANIRKGLIRQPLIPGSSCSRPLHSDVRPQLSLTRCLCCRYVVVIVDLSKGMNGSDDVFRPSRAFEVGRLLPNFFKE